MAFKFEIPYHFEFIVDLLDRYWGEGGFNETFDVIYVKRNAYQVEYENKEVRFDVL